jgi:hypothetical protein
MEAVVTSLIEQMYPLPDYRRTPLTLLRWWESRRPLYNRVVGGAGLITAAGVWLISALPPFAEPIPLLGILAGSVAYGVMANLFYTSGWLLEVLAVRMWGRGAPDLGPVLFRQGVIFSVGLTFFPLVLVAIAWVLQVITSLI